MLSTECTKIIISLLAFDLSFAFLLKNKMSLKFGKKIFSTITRKYSQNFNGEVIINHLKGPHNGITLLGLNKAQQKNAMSKSLLNQISNGLGEIIIDNRTKVLVFHSLVRGIFCAGADLKERADMSEEDVHKFVSNFRNLIYKIYNIPIPTIAALDGVALGGGLEMALACDIRITANDSKMGLVETKLAIMPGAGGTQLLPRLINPSIAKELIFTAKIMDGNEAKELGIVNHIYEQNQEGNIAFMKSLHLAEKILPNGPLGVKMAKKSINKGIGVDLNTGLAIEEACYAQLIPTKDRLEGLQAFKEKRKPVFRGV